MALTVGSLFSGIGGLDLGLERAGMEVIWQSEIDPYACKVLSKHWPEVVNHGNIKEINWQEVERPDVICGGYPCQPFSTAGKRRGEEDPRHLWPWVREAISQLRPRYAILENVRGHLSMGGLSVIAELATIGYDAEWRVVSAASVGANHRRDRIVIVAYPNNTGNRTPRCNTDADGTAFEQGRQVVSQSRSCGCSSTVANTDGGNSSDGGECKTLPSKGGSRRNDRRGSGSDTRKISVGSTGENAKNVADTNSQWGHQQCQRQVQEPNIGGCCANMANTSEQFSNERGHGHNLGTHETTGSVQGSLGRSGRNGDVANTNSERLERQRPEQQTTGASRNSEEKPLPDNECIRDGEYRVSSDAGQEDIRRVYNGRREEGYVGWQWWETEPNVGRVAHGIPSRVDRLRGLGNAVVPQVAEVIGRLVISDYQRRED